MNNIEKYFLEDRVQLGIGIFISVFSLGIAGYLFLSKNMLYKGMSYGIIPLTIVLFFVCIFLFFRTPYDMKKAKALYQAGSIKMQTVELPRMQKVARNFDWIIKTEVCLISAAITMLLIFWKNDQLRGIAIGVTTEAAILLIFDSIETERAKIYIEFLKTL